MTRPLLAAAGKALVFTAALCVFLAMCVALGWMLHSHPWVFLTCFVPLWFGAVTCGFYERPRP